MGMPFCVSSTNGIQFLVSYLHLKFKTSQNRTDGMCPRNTGVQVAYLRHSWTTLAMKMHTSFPYGIKSSQRISALCEKKLRVKCQNLLISFREQNSF